MLRITYLILLFNVSISFSSFSQERKIEKKVYSNFRDGKLDLALTELDNLKDKYGDKSFFHYWKAIIYMEKLSQLKNYEEINRDNAVFFIDISLRTLKEASQYLTAEELSISKEDFEILFPGCIVTPPNGETKYTHCIISLKSEFYIKEEYLRELQYNLSLGKLIEECKYANREITPFLKEIKPRVKLDPAKNPLYGEVSKSTYMELANIRNQRELVQLQKELTDKNWINYIKTYKEEEYLSIVSELEKLINKFYFNNLENQYQKIKNNAFELKTYLANLEENKNLMETNALKYINSKYGEIKLSNSFMELRKVNYYKIINEGTIKMKENIERQKKFEEEFSYNEKFEDNFEKNTNGWYESEDQSAINKIANGKFIFENKTAGGFINLANKRIPTNIEDFLIFIDTKWIKGIDNNSYQILWGANGFSEYYVFGISANGSYRYMSFKNGNNIIHIDWKASEYINKNGSNNIGVRKNGTQIEFYINYFKVNEFEFSEFYGDQIGMSVNGAQRVEFDDLKIGYTNTIFAAEDNFEQEEAYLESNDIRDGYGPGVKDINGNNYKTVYIGTQEWMGENLKVSKYSDGTVIPNITDITKWGMLSKGAWVYYNNDASKNTKYGKLYNWYAVSKTTNSNKNLCPTGWHVPSDSEWTVLIDYLGGKKVAGGKMKEVGTTYWNSPNIDATNTSLFTGLPGGNRSPNGYYYGIGLGGNWWSSSESNTGNIRALNYGGGDAYSGSYGKKDGLSVRCLRD